MLMMMLSCLTTSSKYFTTASSICGRRKNINNHMICSALQEVPCFKIFMNTNFDDFHYETSSKRRSLTPAYQTQRFKKGSSKVVRAQFNKRLKETLRARISSVIFRFFWPRQGNLLGIRVIRKLVKKPRGKRGKEDKDRIRFPGSRSC